jgi:hypothetical protein
MKMTAIALRSFQSLNECVVPSESLSVNASIFCPIGGEPSAVAAKSTLIMSHEVPVAVIERSPKLV